MVDASLTLNEDRWQWAQKLARRWVSEGQATAITCLTGTVDGFTASFQDGTHDCAGTVPLSEHPLYLVASITKPIVAMAVLQLVEQGELTLGDRISDLFPQFGQQGKYGVELRHLLTHTSGLPDMLPNNNDLRAANADLSEFFAETCRQPLAFPAGRGVQYQSMGFVVLAEIIAKVTGRSCAEYVQDAILRPLEMTQTVLGAPDHWFDDATSPLQQVVEVRLTPQQSAASHWNWNSRYWRQLGAPWGGLLTTADDLARLSRCLLSDGCTYRGERLWSTATIEAATRNQLEPLRDLPETDRRCRPWGLGWRLNWPAHSANFGDLLGPRTYGHWGATGTLLWIDPDRQIFTVILSSQPQEPTGHFLARLSNIVAASWE